MSDLRELVNTRGAAMAVEQQTTAAFGPVDKERVLSLIGLNPRDPKAHAVVAVAERYGLDPVLGHIMILPKGSLPYVTRDGFLHIAHRSGQLDGIEVVDGPRREGNEWVAQVAVYRKDMSHPFIYPGRADIGGNGPEMAIARAERRALRRAFAVTLPHVFADDELDPRAAVSEPVRQSAAPYGSDPRDLTPPRVVDVELPEPAATAPGTTHTAEPDDPATDVREIAKWQMRALQGGFKTAGIPDRDERLALTSEWIGRDVGSASDLTYLEAGTVLERLAEMNSPMDDPAEPGDDE